MALDLDDDPFAGSSLFSLVPRTLSGAPAAAAELDSFEAFLKSMMLNGSVEVVEQAQAISQSSLNILSMEPKGTDEAVVANGKDHPRGRRPALGRKRAQFSLKPESSQAIPNVDINSIEDPEEYFLACENLENAERELKKLKRGVVSTELLLHPQSMTARKRRPGILGKTVTYKHLFPAEGAMLSQEEISDAGHSILSQTTMDVDSRSLLHPKTFNQPQSSQVMKANVVELYDANEGEGSVAQKEKKVDDLFCSLLSCEDLDGEKGQAFLRERLQIPQIDVGKMHLPCQFSSQKENVNTLNNISVTKKLGNSEFVQTSKILPKSPLAAIFSMQRRLSLKNSLKDQYLLRPSDEILQTEKSSLTGGPDGQLISPSVDIDHHDTKSDRNIENMITSWKSRKLISVKDLSKNQDLMHPNDDALSVGEFSQKKIQDTSPISPSLDIDHRDASNIIRDGASTPTRTKGKSLTFGDKAHSPFSRSDRTVNNKVTSTQDCVEHSPSSPERDTGCYSSRFDSDKNATVEFYGCTEEKDNAVQPHSSACGLLEPELDGQVSRKQLSRHSLCMPEKVVDHTSRRSDRKRVALSMEFDDSLQEKRNNTELDASVCVQMKAGLEGLSSESVDPNAKEDSANHFECLSSESVDPNAKEDSASHLGSGIVRHADNNAFGYDTTMEGEANNMLLAEKRTKDVESVEEKSDTPQRVSPTDGHLENACVTLEENNVGLQADPAKPSHRRRKEKVLSQRQGKQKSASKRQSPVNSRMSSGKGRRLETAPSGQKKNKSISRRQSLAGAGTTWQAGVRRSTRIKSRPLQYWCGERFLYGRIHDSLPTVVGIKYASPGDAKLKVKSYVPDEYSVLLMPYNEH